MDPANTLRRYVGNNNLKQRACCSYMQVRYFFVKKSRLKLGIYYKKYDLKKKQSIIKTNQ